MRWRHRTALLAWMPAVLLLAGMLGGCLDLFGRDRSAVIGEVTYNLTSKEVDVQVAEDGCNYTFSPLRVFGLKDQDVVVRLYSGQTLLGEERDSCPYAGTRWESFSIFVPHSRMAKVSRDFTYDVYVVPSSDRQAYIAKRTFNAKQSYEQVWAVSQLLEDADLPDGQKGVQIKFRLELTGHRGENLPVLLLLKNRSGEEYRDADGNLLRLKPTTLNALPDAETSVWDALTVNIPYAAVSHLDPGAAVVLTPSLIYPDDKYREGNVHVTFYVGGSLATQEKRLRAEKDEVDELIRYREKELEALQRGGGK